MKFVTLKEENTKENETFVLFLQYDNNMENLKKLTEIINSADTSEMYGDYSKFSIDIINLVSEQTVQELCKIDIGVYGPLFSSCYGVFSFPHKDFDNLSNEDKALKLDELFYPCRISDYFQKEKIEESNSEKVDSKIDKKSLLKIFEAWKEEESSSDIYHMILDWINKNQQFLKHDKKASSIIEEILTRMESNDETNDIVEDFVVGYKYEYLSKSILGEAIDKILFGR